MINSECPMVLLKLDLTGFQGSIRGQDTYRLEKYYARNQHPKPVRS